MMDGIDRCLVGGWVNKWINGEVGRWMIGWIGGWVDTYIRR